MRTAYLTELHKLATENKNIYALISDNGAIVYDKYRRDFPEQYINCGISEANMIGFSAGMAICGKIPFAYTISNFLTMRAFEFIRNDVCLQNMNVKLVGTGAGFSYSALGPTHHATEDLTLMRVLPNLTILSPASPMEVMKATRAAAEFDGPVYLRLGTNKEQEIYENDYSFEIGKGVVLIEGSDIALISTGAITLDVLQAAKDVESQGVKASVINIHTLKPLDKELIIEVANQCKRVITVEEHNINGALGSAVAETILESGISGIKFKRIGLNDTFAQGYGKHFEVKEMNGLSINSIKEEIFKMV